MVDMRILEAEIEFGFSALPEAEVGADADAGSMPFSRSVAASSSLTKF
jgi:hypothetical protein